MVIVLVPELSKVTQAYTQYFLGTTAKAPDMDRCPLKKTDVAVN